MALLRETHPDVYSQIVKNGYPFDISTLSTFSIKRVAFRCGDGHVLESTPRNRVRSGCSECSRLSRANRKTVADVYPWVANYLADQSERDEILSIGATKVWQEKSYSFYDPDRNLIVKRSIRWAIETLPEIDSPIVIPDDAIHEESLSHVPLSTVSEYLDPDVEYPETLPRFSKTVFTWKCPIGHQWEGQAGNLLGRKRYCPYCGLRKFLRGFNDLGTFSPEIVRWMPGKDPSSIFMRTDYRDTFTCPECSLVIKAILSRPAGDNPGRTIPRCLRCERAGQTLDKVSETAARWYSEENETPLKYVYPWTREKALFVCDQGHRFEFRLDSIAYRGGIACPRCKASLGEQVISEILCDILPERDIIHFDRQVLGGRELDFWIPSLGVAIEFNGVYWHSEQFVGRDRHVKKWRDCKERGIRLLTVWEDDLAARPDAVRGMILSALGHRPATEADLRNTEFSVIDQPVASMFLDKHHIQGCGDGGDIHVGGKTTGILTSASSWHVEGTVATLLRYASLTSGAAVLSKHLAALREATGHTVIQIVAHSDRSLSDEDQLEALGFVLDEELSPDYSPLIGSVRASKAEFSIERFQSDPDLIYEEGLSEEELSELNAIPRVWDCGRARYSLDILAEE